jgi:hypothetical protein
MEHTIDPESGCCVICGQLVVLTDKDGNRIHGHSLACPGPITEEEVDHDFESPAGEFLPLATEYDPTNEDRNEYECHNPDEPAYNVLCPVCFGRPCLPGCRLGFATQDLADLNKGFE